MGNKRGFSGLMLIIIILLVALGGAVLVFEFFGKLAEKEDEEDPSLQEAAVQAEANLSSPSPKEKVCYDQKVFWKWQTGDKNGLAQVYFGSDNKSGVGSLLDEAGKNTVYTFSIESDGKGSVGQRGTDNHAYGNASVGCDTITISIKGACSESCNLDGDSEEYLKTVRIDPASLGLGTTITIKQ